MNRPLKPLVLFTETPSWRKAAASSFGSDKPIDERADRRIACALARLTRAYAPPTDKERR